MRQALLNAFKMTEKTGRHITDVIKTFGIEDRPDFKFSIPVIDGDLAKTIHAVIVSCRLRETQAEFHASTNIGNPVFVALDFYSVRQNVEGYSSANIGNPLEIIADLAWLADGFHAMIGGTVYQCDKYGVIVDQYDAV